MNIFEKHGIKEVANVWFYALSAYQQGGATIPAGSVVLYLDTLKVSTIEQTAENVAATGGRGNPDLIIWDFGREITITLDDALISLEGLRFMFGGSLNVAAASATIAVPKTEVVRATAKDTIAPPTGYDTTGGSWINLTSGARGMGAAPSAVEAGDRVRFFWEVAVNGTTTGTAVEIVVSAETFPGVYKVVGEALMRSQVTGADDTMLFIVEKAKVISETTISMEAEGDPSVFSMQLRVLRDDDGNMIRFVKVTEPAGD